MRQIAAFFARPLMLVLLAASVVSAALGETVNASIIVLMVGLSVALEFVQTSRSQQAAARLRETQDGLRRRRRAAVTVTYLALSFPTLVSRCSRSRSIPAGR